jgi:tRNA1Val (adenine37-N6)-methyltransferase
MVSEKATRTVQISLDAIFEGRVLLHQHRRGYRFAADAPLLTWFACGRRRARAAVDIGAGCGVVGLGLLAAGAADRVVAIEIQPRLAELCLKNARANGLEDAFEVVVADALEADDRLPDAGFDLVVANPPFWPADKGRLPQNKERRIACHEVALTLDGWVTRARQLLAPRRGRLCVVFPARRADELIAALETAGLSATRLLPVHPRAADPAELILVEARAGRPGRLVLQPQLVLKNESGEDTADAARILNGRFSRQLRARRDRRPG